MRYRLLVLSLLLASATAMANDSAVHGVGGTVAPMDEHPSVRMVRERVDVELTWECADVRCEFVFRNEGAATTVKIGFPETAYGDVGPIGTSAFQNFRSWVDGRRIGTRLIPSAGDGRSTEYQAWHVKDVSFGADQTRVIVNEYSAPVGQDSMGGRFFEYVLRTGKTWKGNVGEAVINVDISRVPVFWQATPSGSGSAVIKGSEITWRLRDFEPDEDVSISIECRQKVFIGGPKQGTQVTGFDPSASSKHGITIARVTELQRIKGCSVSWDAKRRECTVAYGDNSLLLHPGSKRAALSGRGEVQLPVAPYLIDSRLYMPIVAVAKAVGMTAAYDEKTRFISILGSERD